MIENSLEESKALNIVVINLKGKTDIADFMIVASGTSSRHVNSCASKLTEELRHNGIKGVDPEGTETGDWVLVDAIDVIVHIFKPEIREKYELEKMWQMPAEKKERKRRTKTNLAIVGLLLGAISLTACSKDILYQYPPYRQTVPVIICDDLQDEVIEVKAQPQKPVLKKRPKAKLKPVTRIIPGSKAEQINQAYRDAGTKRTRYADVANTIPANEDLYLRQLFEVTDIFVVEKVRNLSTRNYQYKVHEANLARLKQLDPPKDLAPIHAKIVTAFSKQLDYYKKLNSPGAVFKAGDEEVQTSHNELYGAYLMLIEKYSGQSAEVKNAIFSQLYPACFI